MPQTRTFSITHILSLSLLLSNSLTLTHTHARPRTRLLSPSFPRPPSLFFTGEGTSDERWGAGVETQKNVRGEVGGWGRVPFNEPYAPSLSTIYDGA